MAITPMRIPATIRAGDTISWLETAPDYPASDGWTLSWRLINSAGKIDIASTPSGADHLVSVLASSSADWAAGKYSWVSVATRGVDRKTVNSGSVEILPDLVAMSVGFDTRTTAKKLLDSVEAALINRASRTDLEYEIAGRRLKSMTHGELLAARDKLKREVSSEEKAARIAAGLPAGNRVLVRFG